MHSSLVFGANEAFRSFSKDLQEQLLKDLLTIELARNVLSNLASDSKASPSASASLTRLEEQRLSTGLVATIVTLIARNVEIAKFCVTRVSSSPKANRQQ